ncbi:hypothetical protein DMP08_05490 [Paraeggerthella hongkongensis]|uniref:Uncharacterized protein n=1 Tax=Paraeggerthella hongkongensis TaxID=230658 RepID=A0A3N0BDW9_9ACTN|nr:hypothetical protein DMP08_05490 [Paraeggerthella hongkongensis]
MTAEQLSIYAGVPPYRFDGGLIALWHFTTETPCEMLSNGAIVYASGAEVSLRENTVRDPEPPAPAFAMPDAETGMSKAAEWESRTAAAVLLESLKALSGQDATSGFRGQSNDDLNGSVALLMDATLAKSSDVRQIEQSGDPAKESLVSLFSSLSTV